MDSTAASVVEDHNANNGKERAGGVGRIFGRGKVVGGGVCFVCALTSEYYYHLQIINFCEPFAVQYLALSNNIEQYKILYGCMQILV